MLVDFLFLSSENQKLRERASKRADAQRLTEASRALRRRRRRLESREKATRDAFLQFDAMFLLARFRDDASNFLRLCSSIVSDSRGPLI